MLPLAPNYSEVITLYYFRFKNFVNIHSSPIIANLYRLHFLKLFQNALPLLGRDPNSAPVDGRNPTKISVVLTSHGSPRVRRRVSAGSISKTLVGIRPLEYLYREQPQLFD